jgi:hypothetical protein
LAHSSPVIEFDSSGHLTSGTKNETTITADFIDQLFAVGFHILWFAQARQ